ncbi:MAG: hypothetical protein U1F65_11495 [Verrucomicrobiota bacterium]
MKTRTCILVHRCRRGFLLAALVGLVALAANAGTVIKINNPTALNLPGAADSAGWDSTVTGANTSALGASAGWLGIKVASPGGDIVIASNAVATLTLGASGVDLSAATVNLTLGCPLVLGSAQTWTAGSGRSLTAGSSIGGSSPGTFVKSAAGRLVLSAGNSSFTYGVIGYRRLNFDFT